ncbi:hypothetical protein TNIN_422861 [Trichonephila inaurata madagascariensis]|uniref:Uncharacterized protein n=1 Tax=Trichonephila inaurata madagascariensis TaxID=2747483 RepID=A0A8X6YCT1_9ARAC|nr:hypothetical protein TNIN_422861 [Trichonephila inaurata madagascariensis]
MLKSPHCTPLPSSFESEEKQEQARHGFSYPRHRREKNNASSSLTRLATQQHLPHSYRPRGIRRGDGRESLPMRKQPETKTRRLPPPIVAKASADSAKSETGVTSILTLRTRISPRLFKKIASIVIDAS